MHTTPDTTIEPTGPRLTRRRRLAAAGAVGLAGILALGACGDDDEGNVDDDVEQELDETGEELGELGEDTGDAVEEETDEMNDGGDGDDGGG